MSEPDAIQHLVRIIGLCQVPREQWSAEDNLFLREAREFIQSKQEEKKLASKGQTGDPGAAATSAGEESAKQDSSGVDKEVQPDGDAFEAGPEDPAVSVGST